MSEPVQGRGGRLDPDALAALEEEREFLLRSIADLEREHAAGDIDDDDFRTLRDDYTVRAAEVLRAIDDGRAAFRDAAEPTPWSRRLLTVGAVVLVAVVAGVLVTQASGRRGSSGLTGLDVTAASQRIGQCAAADRDGETDEAFECYSEILESLPSNVPALTGRGWLQVRNGDLAEGIADLDAAVQLRPDDPGPYVFRASARDRNGDPIGAVADLAAFTELDPPAEVSALADDLGLIRRVVPAAREACIAGDVSGELAPVDVLQCYRNVLIVAPGDAEASAYLGFLLAKVGQVDEALALLDDAIDGSPDYAPAHLFRAGARAAAGDFAGALDDLDRFDELDAAPAFVAAAEEFRAAVEAGRNPLARG